MNLCVARKKKGGAGSNMVQLQPLIFSNSTKIFCNRVLKGLDSYELPWFLQNEALTFTMPAEVLCNLSLYRF